MDELRAQTGKEVYQRFWQKALDYKGRTSRSDYWLPVFMTWILLVILYILAGLCSLLGFTMLAWVFVVISTLFSMASFVPLLSSMVRRVRDAGERWEKLLWVFVPLVGGIYVLMLLCKESQRPKKRRKRKSAQPRAKERRKKVIE